jgi:uncharacterized protein (TIGR03086 family)
MGTAIAAGPGTDLLAQALDYTGGVLGVLDESPPPLARPTPCRDWDLGRLLAHMEDSLDAFAEGAAGEVGLDPRAPVRVRTAALRSKACGLLRAWSAAPGTVRIGDRHLPAQLVAVVASLEITVHGWDVVQAIGLDRPIPDPLARALLAVAPDLVADDDRVQRFGPPIAVDPAGPAETRLLAFLGRVGGRPLAAAW